MESLIVHSGYDTPIQARVTTTDDPGVSYGAARDWFVMDQMSKFGNITSVVTESQALTYAALFACVRAITGPLCSIGWHVYQVQPDGRTRLPIEDNIAWTLNLQSNPEMTALDWRQVMLKDALLCGNGYAEIERSNSGKPMWLWRIDPWRVYPERDESGALYYTVRNDGAPDSYIDPLNMFHLKGLGPDGVVGWSIITLARKTIELGLSQENYGRVLFRRGPTPGGVLTIPGAKNPKQDDETRESFERTYGGTRNAGRVVVLRGGATFQPLTISSADAEFLASRTFNVQEFSRWFGVPPHKLGDLTKSSFSNIEEQERAFVADCLLTWARRLETEADVKLFGRVTQGRRYTRLNLDALLRGNSQTQTETVAKKVQTGLMTPNEGRAYFDLNPDPDGDTLVIQGAMITLESVVDPPEPPPVPELPPTMPPAEPDAEPMPGEGDNMPMKEPPTDKLREAFVSLLADSYSWFLAFEGEKAKKAAKGGNLESWANGFFNANREADISPLIERILAAFLLATGNQHSAANLAKTFAADHVTQSRGVCTLGLHATADWTMTRARRQAERHIAAAMNGEAK